MTQDRPPNQRRPPEQRSPGRNEASPSGFAHRRRRRRKKPQHVAPAEVVASAAASAPALSPDKSVEEPLSSEELAVMQRHLRFLREHRKVLQLRVNAHEDLLLNEVRAPTRRGVCQHLLSKVDRARVFAAAERLEPAAATRLSEGVLRIAPDVDYLLLYLDCVRRSASQEQAVLALSEALERIDFSQVSVGQLRRVLDLIVELFDERQRVVVVLGLLSGSAFREAVDGAGASLPEPLQNLVLPLRAAQAAVLRGKRGTFAESDVLSGVELLLASDPRRLLGYAPRARRELLETGLKSEKALSNGEKALSALLESLSDDAHEHGRLGLTLAKAWIAAGNESAAKKLLSQLSKRHKDFRLPRRWLEALEGPRIDRFALITDKADSARSEASSKTNSRDALWLDTMQRVSLYVARAPDDPDHQTHEELFASLLVPSIAPLLHSGRTDQGLPYFAVTHFGQRLSALLNKSRRLEAGALRRTAAEICVLLCALVERGVELPDAGPDRFEIGSEGRPWLVDLTGARRVSASEARKSASRAAATVCQRLLESDEALAGLKQLSGSAADSVGASEPEDILSLSRRLARYLG